MESPLRFTERERGGPDGSGGDVNITPLRVRRMMMIIRSPAAPAATNFLSMGIRSKGILSNGG